MLSTTAPFKLHIAASCESSHLWCFGCSTTCDGSKRRSDATHLETIINVRTPYRSTRQGPHAQRAVFLQSASEKGKNR